MITKRRPRRIAGASCACGCLALLGGLWGSGARAWSSESAEVVEKVKKSLVRVTFNQLSENESRIKRQCVGTFVDKHGLVAISGEMLPRQVPDSRFADFKVKLATEAEAKERDAELLVRDQDLFTALLRVTGDVKEGEVFPAVTFGAPAALKTGDRLYGFGLLPEGYGAGANFGEGHVVKSVEKPQPLIVVSGGVAVAPFGPVANAQGEVIGFNIPDPLFDVAGFQRVQGEYFRSRGNAPNPNELFQRATVLLPVDRLAELLKKPQEKRKRTWIGVADLQPLTKDVATVMGLPELTGGVIVGRVLEGQPADKAGFKAEDVVTKMDGEALVVKDENDLKAFLERMKKLEVGRKVKLSVLRNKKEEILEIVVGERPKEESEAVRYEDKDLGLILRELVFYDALNRDLTTDFPGLFVHYVKPGSWPELGGMRAGDILTKIDEIELKGAGPELLAQFKKIVAELKEHKKKEFVFFVSRGKKGQNAAFIKIEADWK